MNENIVNKLLITAITTVLLLTGVSPLFAQSSEWAVKMFSELGTERLHNFGSVALHADVEKRFPFKNIYNEDVVISSTSSNCGCTKASVSKQVIHPGEIGEVIARVDTSGREHTKQRKATIRVVFSKPLQAEVQLQVKTYIRPDVGFDPGVIEFGTVQHGTQVLKKAYLQYAGRSDWALIGVQKNAPGVRAEAREVRRQSGSVVYEILVELKPDAPPGYIHDLLRFQTNESDPTTSSIFLPLEGLVVEPLSAKPSFLQLGVVEPGKKVTRNVVVSGSEPFKILEIDSSDPRVSGQKTNLTRAVHVLPITFTADDETGVIDGQVEIVTSKTSDDGEPQKLTISMTGVVTNRDLATRNAKPEIGGIPAAVDVEPTPLGSGKTPRDNKKGTNTKSKKREIEMKKLGSNENDKSLDDSDEAPPVDDASLESTWKPVRKEELEERTKRHAIKAKQSSPDEEGEWTSDWKQVRNDEPELVSHVPSTKTFK
jgi:hypothetical protein